RRSTTRTAAGARRSVREAKTRQLDRRAAVHDDLEAVRLGACRRRGVADPELHPHRFGADRDSLVDDRPGGLARSEEHTSELQSLPTRRSPDLAARRPEPPPAPGVQCARPRRGNSIAGQRSMTTLRPCASARAAAAVSLTPSCIHTALAPIATAWSTIAPAASLDRKSTRLNSSHSLHDALPISPLDDPNRRRRPAFSARGQDAATRSPGSGP